ncbi:TPA: hypothetical protein EYO57_26650, partial [Candidatus Poribacteria bacterium]|nr:hypothetical protein [Candidatus Poribacteria bacterium]
MNSNTFPSKLNFFGVFSLIVMLSLFSSLAYGAATVSPASTIFIAGSSDNSVTINITGATNAQGITVTPPAGWVGAGVTVASGSATATGGTALVPVISVAPTASGDITIVYTATAGTTADLVSFVVREVTQADTSFSVDVVADGSGIISFANADSDADGVDDKFDVTVPAETTVEQVAGRTAQTINMWYTAVGNSTDNAGVLSGGTLVLDIPAAFAAPNATSLAVFKADGTALTVGTIGIVTYVGNRVTVPLTIMNGGDQLLLKYSNVTIPAAAAYNFAIGTASSSPAFGVPFKVGNGLALTVEGAGVGTGTVVAEGGPYSAASTGNTITFKYIAAGTMTGGRIEIIAPTGWTAPQGEPGRPGYTIAIGPDGAQYATSDVLFDVSAADGFSGSGVGIKVGTLELNQVLKVIYGYTGTASGATAATTTGFSRFEVNSTPNASLDDGRRTDITTGLLIVDSPGTDDDDLADPATKFSTANQPKVSVQAGDGSGSITITTNPAAVTASASTTITVAYKVAGLISEGAFFVKFPGNWPVPSLSTDVEVDGRVAVTDDGATLGTASFVGRELTVPITFIQAAKTITVTYVGTAPSRASADGTQLILKSRGTASGSLAVIINTKDDPDPDLNYWPIAIGKAGNGSGLVGVDTTTVTAGSIGNIFKITYKAVGQLDGGKIKISRPAGWTAIEANISANSTKVVLDAVASDDDHAIYKITTLGKDEQVTFTYSGVEVPKDRSINNAIGFQVTNFNDDTDAYAAVTTNLSDTLVVPSAITVDYAADGTGTVAIYENGTTTAVSTQAALESQTLDIVYTPFAQMFNGKIVLLVPAGWTAPQGEPGTADAPVNINVTGAGTITAVDGIARTVTVSNIYLDETSSVKIRYSGAKAPSVGGVSVFSLTAQGHILDANDPLTIVDETGTSPAGRALVAVSGVALDGAVPTLGVSINVGDVVKGRGKAGITYPWVQSAGVDTADVTTDDVFKREFLKGATNEKIVFYFEAVGPMSGADVQFEIDSDYVTDLGSVPQTTSTTGVAYASVTSAPAGSYTGLSIPNTQVKYLRLSGVTLITGQKIEITLSNLSFPSVRDYTFPVYMRYGASDSFSDGRTLSADGNTLETYLTGFEFNSDNAGKDNLPLTLKSLSVEGKGTLAVTPGPIFRTGTTNNYYFQFTAAASTGGLLIDVGPNFTAPRMYVDPNAATKVSLSTADTGFVRMEQGVGTLSVTGTTIMVKEMSLTVGQSVTLGYYQATYGGNAVGAVTFNGRTTSDVSVGGTGLNTGTANLDSDNVPTVYFISSDGVGMVTRTSSDTIAPTGGTIANNDTRQPVINGNGAGTAAGSEVTVDFYYSLDLTQYVKSGELELMMPSNWTIPVKGLVAAADRKINAAYNTGIGQSFVAFSDDDWASQIAINNRSIIVSIDAMSSIAGLDNVLKVSYTGTSPNNAGDSTVTVLQRSGNLTARTDITKNRKLDIPVGVGSGSPISGSAVRLKTTYGDAKKGTVTSSTHAAYLSAGSGPHTFSFTYTTPVEVDPATQLILRIPAGTGNADWTVPVMNADDATIAAGEITTSTLPVTDTIAGTTAGVLGVATPRATGTTGTLKAGGSITITYNTATAPSVAATEYATTGQVFALTINSTDFTDKDAGTAATGTVLADSTDVASNLAIGNTDIKAADGALIRIPTGVFVTTLVAPTIGTGSVALLVTTTAGADPGNNETAYDITEADLSITQVSREQVHAGDTGVIVTMTYTSAGQMDGQFIRLVVPDGWTAPQGNPSVKGYTPANNIGVTVGYPSYSAQTVSFPIVSLAYNSIVTITYGSGGSDNVVTNTGADVPNTSATAASAPLFKLETSSDGTSWTPVGSGIAVDIVSARVGTGTAVISPASSNAGDILNYTVTYTAASTMDGGTVSLVKPSTFTMAGETQALKDANWIADAAADDPLTLGVDETVKVLVATSGTLKTADTTTTPDTVPFARTAPNTVTAYINILPVGGTVTFTINGLTAPSTTSDDGLAFIVKSTGGVNSEALADIMTIATPAVAAAAASPKVVVLGAKDGSGTAALTGPSITKVGTVFAAGSNIVVTYTAVAAMAKGAQVTLEIPAGWTAPVIVDDTTTTVVEKNLSITGIGWTTPSSVIGSAGETWSSAVSGQTITGTIGENGIVATNTVVFTYLNPTAQATAGTAEFKVRSSVSGVPAAADIVTDSPSITVAQSGGGSGKLAVSPTTNEVNTSATYTFTYTASEAVAAGAVTVTIPNSWTAPLLDDAGTTDVNEANISAGTISGRTVTVPIATLAAGASATF